MRGAGHSQPALSRSVQMAKFSVTAREVQVTRWAFLKIRAYRVVRPEVTACVICMVLANMIFDSVST